MGTMFICSQTACVIVLLIALLWLFLRLLLLGLWWYPPIKHIWIARRGERQVDIIPEVELEEAPGIPKYDIVGKYG